MTQAWSRHGWGAMFRAHQALKGMPSTKCLTDQVFTQGDFWGRVAGAPKMDPVVAWKAEGKGMCDSILF